MCMTNIFCLTVCRDIAILCNMSCNWRLKIEIHFYDLNMKYIWDVAVLLIYNQSRRYYNVDIRFQTTKSKSSQPVHKSTQGTPYASDVHVVWIRDFSSARALITTTMSTIDPGNVRMSLGWTS